MTRIAVPLRFDHRGRTADRDLEGHIRDLIETILFTSPGERVNRPSFGSGIDRLVFDPASPELAAATQHLVQGALQQWLGGRAQVTDVSVEARGASLKVRVEYEVPGVLDARVVEIGS